ncbi:MAG: hypothetical protein ACNI3C_05445 [Candidatus Marinarcus sp.]|uniref:hypothetical protein n=1 Tax=Candidatus Marinarcus sp. TaxID=3100987 RepID=UPI003AFFC913
MHKILVAQECGCFKRSDLTNNVSLPSKDEALLKAVEMKDIMNEEFCGKHGFELIEENNNFVISFKQEAHSGCCGGGHCN